MSEFDAGTERFIVYHPGDREAGLSVRYDPNPAGPETKFSVEQLWPPSEGEETGRAEPVYVGDQKRVVGLIEALSQALEVAMEVDDAE